MLRTKFNSTKIEFNGYKFDSKLELNIYKKMIELGVEIVALHPKYKLQETFKFEGKTYREITYSADFKIRIKGKEYVIDAKGMETVHFKIKEKLFVYKYKTKLHKIKSVKDFIRWYEELCKGD